MSKLKNYLLAVLTMSLLFTTSIKAEENIIENYFGIKMTATEYNNLLNLGFSEEDIYLMDEDTYINNKDLIGHVVSTNVTRYKTVRRGLESVTYVATEEEFQSRNEVMPLGVVENYWRSVVTKITQIDSNYRYIVSTIWSTMPEERDYDVIAIGITSDVVRSTYPTFTRHYCDYDDCYNSNIGVIKTADYGAGASFKIPSGTLTGLGASLYFDVQKDVSGTLTYQEFCGMYAHGYDTTLADSRNYTIATGGIGFGASAASKYTTMGCSYGTWTGTW